MRMCSQQLIRWTRLPYVCLLLAWPWLASCAGLAEGVTTAFLKAGGEDEPKLQCEAVGPAFDGIAAAMRPGPIQDSPSGDKQHRKNTKVLVVHGVGPAEPDYSVRLQRNLTEALDLTVRQRRSKRIQLRHPTFGSAELGTLTVSRYVTKDRRQEIVFYELVWAEIIAREKRVLAYDTSGRYQSRRASMNHTAKEFLNDRISDPLIYVGASNKKILQSVDQAMCWTLYVDWDELPDGTAQVCDRHEVASVEDLENYQFAIITHSLGSRIVMDTLQFQAEVVMEQFKSGPDAEMRARAHKILEAWKNEPLQLYMLANQLPLLQLGRGEPEVFGQTDAYCRAGGAHYEDRIVNELLIVAFSDPNDLLSYAIPPEYADEYIDSRLCPKVINVSLNIVPTVDLFKLGQIADPVGAHSNYDDDERVIGLITNGIGNDHEDEAVQSGCEWLETVDDAPAARKE